MSTQRQIEANRLNALKSTGPRTAAGKAASSRNALKSGLDAETQFVLGERPEQFAQLQSEWYSYIRPRNPDERYHLDNVIRYEWFLRRYFRVEAQLWEHHSMLAQRATGVELAEGFSNSSPIFMRLQRRIAAAEKARDLSREALARLQAIPDPIEKEAETAQLASFLIDSEPVPAPSFQTDQPAKMQTGFAIPPEDTAIPAHPTLNSSSTRVPSSSI